jgi:hypothetical protein
MKNIFIEKNWMKEAHQKHIVLTLGRSGSNTLVDMLNQHPQILNYGEVLGDWNYIRKFQRRAGLFKKDDRDYLDAVLHNGNLLKLANSTRNVTKLIKRKPREIKKIGELKTIGFKEFSLNFHRYEVSDYLSTRNDIKVITLTRSNIIERMISNELLQATGVISSHTKVSQGVRRKLHLSPKDAIDKLTILEREAFQLEEMINDLDQSRVFRLDYAGLYGDVDRTVEKIRQVYKFLGVQDLIPIIRMTKIVKGDPLLVLENARKVRAAIQQTRFSDYLY